MRLRIEKLVYGGDGLARSPADDQGPGKAVFVPFVLPGEEIEANILEAKPGFARARLDRVRTPSPKRVAPGCPYFVACGGCQYQHALYEHQLEIKASILEETLRRTAKIELPGPVAIHPSPPWHYRNRTRLKLAADGEFQLGYYRIGSRDLLPVKQCPISSPLINRALTALWSLGCARRIPSEVREIELFADHADEKMLLEAYCGPAPRRSAAEDAAEALSSLMPEVQGVAVFEQPRSRHGSKARLLAQRGRRQLVYEIKAARYQVSVGSFFQVNRFMLDELLAVVTGDVSGQLALDLYAGVGLFSTVLARSYAQVVAVEACPVSASDLARNSDNRIKVVPSTSDEYLRVMRGPVPDLVVVDPPRIGLGEQVVRRLIQLRAPRLRYVSCDPSTLARDLGWLLAERYHIREVHLLDLFPQTYHIETLVELARTESKTSS